MHSTEEGERVPLLKPPVMLALLVVAGIVLSVYLWVFQSREITALNAQLALATLWVAMIPAGLYLLRRDATPMPFVALLGLYYAVFFAASCFFFYSLPGHYDYGIVIHEIDVEAQILVFVGLSLMFAAYYIVWRWGARRLPYFRLPLDYSLARLGAACRRLSMALCPRITNYPKHWPVHSAGRVPCGRHARVPLASQGIANI